MVPFWRVRNGEGKEREAGWLLTACIKKAFQISEGINLERSVGVGYAGHCTSHWDF